MVSEAPDPHPTRAADTRAAALDDPRLAPLLPMLYVAWADGELEAEEMAAICQRIRTVAALPAPCSQLLGAWLDPGTPPTARDLQRLLAHIRDGVDLRERVRERLTLAELGLELARAAGGVSEVERAALVEIEQALGVASSEAARQLLATRRPAAGMVRSAPSFPPAIMSELLDGRYRALRRQVRALLEGDDFRHLDPGIDRAAYRRQVLAWCRGLADAGLGALSFPTAYGGGGDLGAFMAAFETLAHHDLSLLIKFGVQFGLFGGAILNLGTERQHARYLADAGSLALPGCFAMSETGHGSNVYDVETVARFDAARDGFEIHTPHAGARKDYIGNAARDGRLAVVFAQLEIDGEGYGVHAFLVPLRDDRGEPLAGIEIEDCGAKMGLNGVDNGRLGFDRVPVPRASLLDRFAQVDADGVYSSPIASPAKRFFTMLGTLVGGRVSVALGALSVAKSALAIAVRYGNRRRQFGAAGEPEIALLDYPAHQLRLLPRLAATYAGHFALRRLADDYAASAPDDDRRALEVDAAGLKAFATWHATDTVQSCRECCGGQGYLAVNRFAALKADSDVFTTFEGDNTVLLQLVAKGLLTRYKKQFGAMSLVGLVRYVAEQASASLAAINPITTRLSDPGHLRDRAFHRAALGWRQAHLLATVARRLKKRIDRGHDTQDALVACQDHLVATARAYVERLVLERFADAVEAADEALRPILVQLCDLYALWSIHRDRGWFLEQGYLEGGKAKAIRKQVHALCAELRPQAEPLVDAFGIPPALLAAPIAR